MHLDRRSRHSVQGYRRTGEHRHGPSLTQNRKWNSKEIEAIKNKKGKYQLIESSYMDGPNPE